MDAPRRFAGRVALVTGGLSGIGRAVAARLAAEGATVIAADIAAAADAPEARPVATARLDVADAGQAADLIAHIDATHGRLDVLVNSAGIARNLPFLETPLALFDQVIAVNLRGTFVIGQAAARLMARQGHGTIVNIGSVSGLRGNTGRTAYGASKGGVVTLSQVMAVELAPHNIRVNVVAPGPIDTNMGAAMAAGGARDAWLRLIPQRRFGTVEDVAAAVAYLASDEAGFVTGEVLTVDGGFMGCGLQPSGEATASP
jgi:NAD(P)-dependent dehydrogenase (short-subunit alcohol dehydrogenase family)